MKYLLLEKEAIDNLVGRNKQYQAIVDEISLENEQGSSIQSSNERKKNFAFAAKISELNGQPLTEDEILLFESFDKLQWTDEQVERYFVTRHQIDGG